MRRIKIITTITFILVVFMIESIIVTAEVYDDEINKQEETQENHDNITEKYYCVTFIDEVRSTKVEKEIKEGEKVTPELIETEKIWINETDYYEFSGWEKSNGEIYNFNSPITSDITIYASYFLNISEKNYANRLVNFNTQGGTAVDSQSVGSKEKYYISEPQEPTKPGYKFLGWYTESTGGDKWNFEKDTVHEAMTLYAHWQYIGNSNLTSPKTGYNIHIYLVILILGLSVFGVSFAKIKEK